jgi:hypothetical protein
MKMQEKTEKTLVDEIIENARKDRLRLEAVAGGLMHGFGKFGDSTEGDPLDPEVSAAFAEEIAQIADSLTKVNQQLVELVKIDAKALAKSDSGKPATKDGKISKKEAEDIYDELAGSTDTGEQEFN